MDHWTILRSEARGSEDLGISTVPLDTTTPFGPLRLAIGPRGEARLLMPLSSRASHAIVDGGDELAVTVSTLVHQGRAQHFLDLMCLGRALEPVFREVVEELVRRVENGSEVVGAVRSTLDDFRTLLAPRSQRTVDRNRVVGLLAELTLLNRLLEKSSTAWRAWNGPKGDRHDFRVHNRSVETKASVRSGSLAVTIHGLTQLEPPSGGTLHLAHLVLEPVAGGPLTIAAMGERALALADDPASLQALLTNVGCTAVKDPSWNHEAFRAEAETWYLVDDDFPRLSPSAFVGGSPPPGVGEVTYRLDLSTVARWKCSPADVERILIDLSQSP